MRSADRFIRENCAENEMGLVIVEDIPEMRANLKNAFLVAKNLFDTVASNELQPTKTEALSGKIQQRVPFGIERIRDGVHFASPIDDPFLQIADAVAFSLRRYLNHQKHGQDLMKNVGVMLDQESWNAVASTTVLSRDPKLRETNIWRNHEWRF